MSKYVSGITPVVAFEVWENKSKSSAHLWLWRRHFADDIPAEMNLALQVTDGETSYVDAARIIGGREATARKIDHVLRDDGPNFRLHGL